MNLILLQTRGLWLSVGEVNGDPSFVRFDTIPECDGRTDRQTDICAIAIPALSIASYAMALVKMK